MGSWCRSTLSPVVMVCWQGAFFTTFGPMVSNFFSKGALSTRSLNPLGGSGWRRYASSSPTSRKAATDSSPIPKATRLGVPNRLASTGTSKPLGFSKSSAGPPPRSVLSAISVISRLGSTSTAMRTKSPRRSNSAMNSRRSIKLGIAGGYLRFIDLKNSSLDLVPLSLSSRNSTAGRSSMPWRSLRKIHIR